jgi:anthranilate/para-aminobenzoate synthase component II
MPVEERLKPDGILVAPGFGESEGGRSSALCSKIKFLFGICLGANGHSEYSRNV